MIAALPQHGACAEELVEAEGAVEDVAADQAEDAFQIEGLRICRPSTDAANPGA